MWPRLGAQGALSVAVVLASSAVRTARSNTVTSSTSPLNGASVACPGHGAILGQALLDVGVTWEFDVLAHDSISLISAGRTDLAAPIGRPVGDTNGEILDLTQPGCGPPGPG